MFDFLRPKKSLPKSLVYRGAIGTIGYEETQPGRPDLEFLTELSGPENLNKFRKMRYNDPVVGGTVLQLENLIASTPWELVGPNSGKIGDMFEQFQRGLPGILLEMVSAFVYGFYIGEMIYKAKDGDVVLLDIAPRYQETIYAINNEDGYVEQRPADMQNDYIQSPIFIPYGKCVHHYFLNEGRNPYGASLLRHAYKPYYYKVAIEASEAMGLERDLSGLPMLTAPEGFDFTAADPESPSYNATVAATLSWAINLVANVRNDKQQGVVKPFGWDFSIIRGENRASVPTSDIINRYNAEITAGLLESFILMGTIGAGNSAGMDSAIGMFLRACDAFTTRLGDTVNRQIIQRIAYYNGFKPPMLKFAKHSRDELADIASFVSRLVDKGVITPTTDLERELLSLSDLPYTDNIKVVAPPVEETPVEPKDKEEEDAETESGGEGDE